MISFYLYRFRCLIQREWWLGTIVRHSPYTPEYPNSNYMCYEVNWDSGEPERMSPWDMDIITDDFGNFINFSEV
jgi:hypothetical protein